MGGSGRREEGGGWFGHKSRLLCWRLAACVCKYSKLLPSSSSSSLFSCFHFCISTPSSLLYFLLLFYSSLSALLLFLCPQPHIFLPLSYSLCYCCSVHSFTSLPCVSFSLLCYHPTTQSRFQWGTGFQNTVFTRTNTKSIPTQRKHSTQAVRQICQWRWLALCNWMQILQS